MSTERIPTTSLVRRSLPFYDIREVEAEISHAAASPGSSPPLGQRVKTVGDQTPVEEVPQTIPFVLTFSHLTYSVQSRGAGLFNRSEKGSKTLLDDISGEARDGEIMAVMGASGSGKSTLIDALANRIARGSLRGSITLNGEALESRLLKAISAYVMQDDLLFPMLTVEETLMFAAEFRLPRRLSNSQRRQRVEALIDQLGLRSVAKIVIGDEGHRGVSSGERRRVSIGIDIVHDPILLLLDEPTSGLDSTSSYMVVKVLKNIAQSGSIVIMSIHQPSSRILGLLDRVIFLSRGETVFNGAPSNLAAFFSDFGREIPEDENRSEFALDFIHELELSGHGTKELVEFNKSWQMMKSRHQSLENTSNLSLKEAISASISRGKLVCGGGVATPISTMATFANPPWTELVILSKRSFTNSWRMPKLFGIRLAAVVVTGFILASVFWRVDNSPKGIKERLSFFALAMSRMFYICADALPVFIQERYIFMRETEYNAYRKSSYVLSHSLVAIPSLVFLSLAYAAITFPSVGLDGSFFFYFLIILASFWAGSGLITFLSSVAPHVMLGYTIVLAILAYFLLLGGFFITRDRIPPYWIWFHYISVLKYPYEAVMHNEFQNPVSCFVRGIQIFDTTPLAAQPESMKVKLLESLSATLGTKITSNTCVTTGADIQRLQGVDDINKWNSLWVIVAWGFFFRFLFFISLLIRSKNKRR